MPALRRRRRLLLLALYATLIVGGVVTGRWLMELVAFELRPSNEPQMHALLMAATAAYVLASAIPFVPGAEIGLALMLVLGPTTVILVYVSMVLALTLAYLVGRLVPPRVIASAFHFFRLERARKLVIECAPLDIEKRLALMMERAPRRIVPFLLRHRYITLALAFNLPGNTLIGGGGGIALAAGMSGIYPFGAFVTVVMLAVAPVPLLLALTGIRV
ncbi:MAG TPA: hypothetical protein VLS27_04110 [Gammaproteobacteria bacterium]|nr:hypothetical protein [Gammaproteobacteria bacterium]